MQHTKLRSGYSGEFVVECPECEESVSFPDPCDSDGQCTRVECDECGTEFLVVGFNVAVETVKDGEGQ